MKNAILAAAACMLALACAGEPGDTIVTVTETTTFARPDGTLDGTEVTYEVLASELGTAHQALTNSACLTDNETLMVVYGSSLGPAWANTARNEATSKLATIANTTGVLPVFQPAANGWDVVVNPATAAEEQASPATLGRTLCSKVTKPGGGGTVSSKCQLKVYVNHIDAIYGIVPGAREAVLQFVMMHEYGHAQGLSHFTSGAQCSDPVGSGATCAWGSKPGGKDTVMSYCALQGLSSTSYQYDGCELEELYWLIGQGAETNATSGNTCNYTPLM